MNFRDSDETYIEGDQRILRQLFDQLGRGQHAMSDTMRAGKNQTHMGRIEYFPIHK